MCPMNRPPQRHPKSLPSRDELVAFIRERSGQVSSREIAKAFGAKNADRAALNRMLRELRDAGLACEQHRFTLLYRSVVEATS